jgi:hypothetical protein
MFPSYEGGWAETVFVAGDREAMHVPGKINDGHARPDVVFLSAVNEQVYTKRIILRN